MSQSFDIGVLWCSFFVRPFWGRRPQLQNAYRPPSLFASTMLAAGYDVTFLVCDEDLHASDLNGQRRTLQDTVNLLYVMTHGKVGQSGYYELLLNTSNWAPGAPAPAGGIGYTKLVVGVFDSCSLIDRRNGKNSHAVWGTASLGRNLRLLLGFDGPAVIDRGAAARGRAFAENLLKGMTFANAWIVAVHQNNPTHSQYNTAVAIGIGDSVADAQSVVSTASLSNVPAARSTGSPCLWESP